jgi:hypothetical protein
MLYCHLGLFLTLEQEQHMVSTTNLAKEEKSTTLCSLGTKLLCITKEMAESYATKQL